MRASKRLLLTFSALAAAGLAGCLSSPEPASFVPVTESEIQAALHGDTLHPAPVRPIVCDTLKARLLALDTNAPQYPGFSHAVHRVCAVHPDSTRGRPPHRVHPDTLKPDTLRPVPPKPDSTRPRPPKARGPKPPRPIP
jgi:hypothetical protein